MQKYDVLLSRAFPNVVESLSTQTFAAIAADLVHNRPVVDCRSLRVPAGVEAGASLSESLGAS
jgi:hypothetical protein